MSQFGNEHGRAAARLDIASTLAGKPMRSLTLAALVIVALSTIFAGRDRGASAEDSRLVPRGFVPEVAADTSLARPSSEGVIAGHISIDDSAGAGAGVWVYGDITNTTSRAVANVTLTASALDTSGATLASREASPVTATIAPGGSAPFRLRLPVFTGSLARVAISIDSFDPANAPASLSLTLAGPREVPVGQPDKVTHVQPISPDLYAIDGTVWNNTNETVQVNGASVALYDGNGNVVLVAGSGPIAASNGSSPPVLGPGDSATYTVYFSRAAYFAAASPVKLVAFADSTTLSSGTP
ncbi:MAG: FxLYD domain-containing protein [Dehalococcoidia bacterium]|nr:FxLYD domain-containing protein [Dehalococcoidia bacterium]